MSNELKDNEKNLLPNDESFEKLKDEISSMSAVIDVGLSQYEVEWQRIATMQQSAGVLIAGLTIVVSALISFLGLSSSSFLVTNREYLNSLVYPTIYVALIFVTLAVGFFLPVIWPQSVKGLPTPVKMFEDLRNEKELWKKLAIIITRTDGSVLDIHQHVERKQKFYLRSLHFFSASVLLTGLIILLLLFKISVLETIKFYYWLLLGIVSTAYVLFVFLKKENQSGT